VGIAKSVAANSYVTPTLNKPDRNERHRQRRAHSFFYPRSPSTRALASATCA